MGNVEFNDEQRRASAVYNQFQTQGEAKGLVKLVMSLGVETPEAANKLLVVIAVICLLGTGYFAFKMNKSNTQKITPEQVQYAQGLTERMKRH